MTTVIKTTEEFCTRRKIRYGGGGADGVKSTPYSIRPSTTNATLSPHKTYYGKDQDGNSSYFIEFNIGDFQFDEITIRTEGHRLIVQGKSKASDDPDELSREFTRDFTLPKNVDQYSIKAQLEEVTRQLTLVGQIIDYSAESEKDNASVYSSSSSESASSTNTLSKQKLGAVKEIKNSTGVDYEIFLGEELKEGQASLEIVGYNTLIVRVVKSDWDKYGDSSLELKRQIKLASNADPQHTEHGIDVRNAILIIKVPFK